MPATIQTGSHGPEVRALQRILAEMKLLDYEQIDGQFGPVTKAAVEDFQAGAGLTVDGVVGPATWTALPPAPDTPLLHEGDHGGAVAALQHGLRTYGGAGAPTDPRAIDGDFGAHTEAAARAYQSDRGLAADGVVGDRTWWVPAGAAGATLASLAGRTTV
jgi:peptidoglycan hydrolase-like protein with peptidoglycan-binding domain